MAEPPKPPPKSPPPQPPFGFTPQEAMTFMQRMWNPFGVAIPGFATPEAATVPGAAPMMPFANPAMMLAALDPAEVERKIGELRIIEGWLQMSLNMMQMSIKTMELQKASLEAMRGAQGGGSAESK